MTTLHQVEGDVFTALPRLPSCWAHGCVTDPPYGWGFMGRDFDRQHRDGAFDALMDEQATFAGWLTAAERRDRGARRLTESERYVLWSLAWFREVYRVLMPGAMLAAFQGSKSYDLTAYAARLAGFEVLPMICGITGQAMAQGGDVGKLIDREAGAAREVTSTRRQSVGFDRGHLGGGGWSAGMVENTAPATPLARDFDGHGTRIRDQLFPVLVAMKPTDGTFASNAARWGVAGFDVDGCRVETDDKLGGGANSGWAAFESLGESRPWHASEESRQASAERSRASTAKSEARGRYPGNVVLDDAAAEEVGEMSGETGWAKQGGDRRSINDQSAYGGGRRSGLAIGDTGTAARYFRRFRYLARAPKSERMRGLETWHWVGDPLHPEGWRRVAVEEWQHLPKRRQMVGSNHPTLKSLEFARWVASLILPPLGPEATRIRRETTGSAGRLLVPFSGVGSECIGAALAGWPEVVAVEVSASYVEQAACRWAAWGPYSSERAAAVEAAGGLDKLDGHHGQVALFEGAT